MCVCELISAPFRPVMPMVGKGAKSFPTRKCSLCLGRWNGQIQKREKPYNNVQLSRNGSIWSEQRMNRIEEYTMDRGGHLSLSLPLSPPALPLFYSVLNRRTHVCVSLWWNVWILFCDARCVLIDRANKWTTITNHHLPEHYSLSLSLSHSKQTIKFVQSSEPSSLSNKMFLS